MKRRLDSYDVFIPPTWKRRSRLISALTLSLYVACCVLVAFAALTMHWQVVKMDRGLDQEDTTDLGLFFYRRCLFDQATGTFSCTTGPVSEVEDPPYRHARYATFLFLVVGLLWLILLAFPFTLQRLLRRSVWIVSQKRAAFGSTLGSSMAFVLLLSAAGSFVYLQHSTAHVEDSLQEGAVAAADQHQHYGWSYVLVYVAATLAIVGSAFVTGDFHVHDKVAETRRRHRVRALRKARTRLLMRASPSFDEGSGNIPAFHAATEGARAIPDFLSSQPPPPASAFADRAAAASPSLRGGAADPSPFAPDSYGGSNAFAGRPLEDSAAAPASPSSPASAASAVHWGHQSSSSTFSNSPSSSSSSSAAAFSHLLTAEGATRHTKSWSAADFH